MADIREIAEIVSDYIKTKGDIKADFSIMSTEVREISMKDGNFTLFRTLFDNNISIKVIKDHKRGTKSINKCTKEAVIAAIDEAIESAEVGDADECFDIAPAIKGEKFSQGAIEPDIEKLMERTKELADDIARDFKKIKIMEMFVKYNSGEEVFFNTNGTRDESEWGSYELFMEFAGNDGENSTGVSVTDVSFTNLDKKLIELGSVRKDLEDAENSLNPITISDKFEGEIIASPMCGLQLLYFVAGNAVMDQALINKTSRWLGKIGEQVASPLLTIRNAPWDERMGVHETHTADGFRTENYDLIENGVLKSYAASLYGANKCGVERAGCSGIYPVIEAGDTSYDDMIKSIKKGLIVGQVSCGMPGASGELSGVAKNAFYIEDGAIKGAVMEVMFSANIFDMVQNIKAISKEQVCNGSMVMPYIQFDKVTISGK
jgi:PmbA protein